MAKNLLLGNGLNIHFRINDLKQESIFERFKTVLLRSSPLYEALFDTTFTTDLLEDIFAPAPNNGIETLAYELYKYLHSRLKNHLNRHEENRLIDAIKTSAINAIFYTGNSKINMSNTNIATVNHLKTYEKVYTLNYVEAWDINNICIYLHGHYDLPNTDNNSKFILLYDNKRINLEKYKDALQTLSISNTILPLNNEEVVFSPLLDKQKILDNRVLYPGADLFPAQDLYAFNPVILYENFNNLDSLDIFGMSPFGDDKLIQKIKLIPDLTIYVYDMINSNETLEWNRILNRDCCKDSSLFPQ